MMNEWHEEGALILNEEEFQEFSRLMTDNPIKDNENLKKLMAMSNVFVEED